MNLINEFTLTLKEAYDACREEAVDQMINEVSKFVYPEECSRGTEEVATGINEIKTDINRAYEILVKACQLSEAEEKEVIAKVIIMYIPLQYTCTYMYVGKH